MDSQGLPLTKSSQERQVRIQLLKQALAAECRRALLVKQAQQQFAAPGKSWADELAAANPNSMTGGVKADSTKYVPMKDRSWSALGGWNPITRASDAMANAWVGGTENTTDIATNRAMQKLPEAARIAGAKATQGGIDTLKDNAGTLALGAGGLGALFGGASGLFSNLFGGGGQQQQQAPQPSFAQPAFNQPKSQYRQSFFG